MTYNSKQNTINNSSSKQQQKMANHNGQNFCFFKY